MSVIIRLQNLPWSANALDIRQYFRGLSIPEGGVHIVGGELGDAFIAFSTDEDARQAFQLNNGTIKEVQIKLLLSSRTEMHKVIEAARSVHTPFVSAIPATQPAQPKPAIIPPVVIISDPKPEEIKDQKSKDSKIKEDARKGRRRSRSRSRSRERNRSRDRRDRRRRDRSRSRDRRDRRRDRRSRSRDRGRSRERESRRSGDRRVDSRSRELDPKRESPGSNSNSVHRQESIEPQQKWEREANQRIPMGVNQNNSPGQPALLGNFPGPANSSLEEARRSLGLITGLHNTVPNQSNMANMPGDLNGGYPRNDMTKGDAWVGKGRFGDRNTLISDKPNLNNSFPPNRPMLGQNDMNFGGNQRNMSMFQSGMNVRPPFNQEMNSNMNRPFMNRPTMSESMPQNRMQDFSYRHDNDRKDDLMRKNNYNRMENGPRSVECCVQLRPYYGGYGDVRRFFNGLYISNSGIKLSTEPNGKRNGVIYIKFVRPDARPQALRKSGSFLRGNKVEILPLSNEEFDECGKQNESDEDREASREREESFVNKPYTCLVVEDIPTFTKEHDILKMFSDYSLLGIHIQNKNRRRMAYVQFNKESDAEQALGEQSKHFLGGKQLVVRPTSDKEFAEVKEEQEPLQNPVNEPEPIEIDEEEEPVNEYSDQAASFDTDVVFLTGLPYKTTDRDVIDFFSDIGLVPTRIHMLLNKFKPSGECYCEFASADEAIAALDKNGMPLGSGIINVEPFPRADMEKNLGIAPKMSQMNHGNNRFMGGRMGPRGGMGMMGPGPRPLMQQNAMMRHMPMKRFDGPVDNNMGPPGCTLALENVPFKAGVDEIVNFFENFDVSTHSVLRRYNDNGSPTGDARVTFNSPVEARRALEECRFRKIRDRTIFLRIL